MWSSSHFISTTAVAPLSYRAVVGVVLVNLLPQLSTGTLDVAVRNKESCPRTLVAMGMAPKYDS